MHCPSLRPQLHLRRATSLKAITVALLLAHIPACSKAQSADGPSGSGVTVPNNVGESTGVAGQPGDGGDTPSSAPTSSVGDIPSPAPSSEGGSAIQRDENPGAGGAVPQYVVAMVQSTKSQATDITQAEVADLVSNAIAQAGGLDFVREGQTVVLKPNLVTPYSNNTKTQTLDPLANGVTTDWRVVKAVADLVRAKDQTGQILVMEGSVVPTATAFSLLGYTPQNFGTSVDEFIGLEGSSCSNRSDDGLEQRIAPNGTQIWVNKRYIQADVVISIPVMKTHKTAGITGGVKNLGIGTAPVAKYAAPPANASAVNDCTRGQTASYIDHTSAETLGQFIHDNFSIRPADFVVMDGLQGLQNGPASMWSGTNYATDKMNMRLIVAGRNAVAVDTIEALVMKCDPAKVPHLRKLEADGLGTTDPTKITLLGKQVSEVMKPFAGGQVDICPGQ